MNHQEQITTVGQALALTTQIAETEEKLEELEGETFRSKPLPPQHTIISVSYPEIQPNVPFWTKALLPTLIFWPYLIIYYFTTYQKAKAAEYERVKNSEEYKARCRAADEDRQRRQAAADEQYQAAMEEYNKEILAYQKELETWTEQIRSETTAARDTLHDAVEQLESLYADTKIVPAQYRDMDALEYLYDMISSSDYTIREAIEMYDKERQRRLEERKIHAQQRANTLADHQLQLTCEQNDLLQQQNAISDRARKDARNAAIIGTVQRHHTNKMLKDAFRKK